MFHNLCIVFPEHGLRISSYLAGLVSAGANLAVCKQSIYNRRCKEASLKMRVVFAVMSPFRLPFCVGFLNFLQKSFGLNFDQILKGLKVFGMLRFDHF